MSDKELIERLRSRAVYMAATKGDTSEAVRLVSQAADRLEALSGGEAVAYCSLEALSRRTEFERNGAVVYDRPLGTYRTPLYTAPRPMPGREEVEKVLDDKIFLRALSGDELEPGFGCGYGVFGLDDAATAILSLFSASLGGDLFAENAKKSASRVTDSGRGALPTPPEGRTPADFAIEHGGYLADAVTRFLDLVGRESIFDEGVEDGVRETVGDHLGAMRSGVYEFEKRASRAKALSGAQRSEGDNGEA